MGLKIIIITDTILTKRPMSGQHVDEVEADIAGGIDNVCYGEVDYEIVCN